MPPNTPEDAVTTAATFPDIVIDWLGRALLEANRVDGSFGQTYADCISMAIVARLLASASGVGTSERSRGSKLAPWRLKRAIDYVEARLDEEDSNLHSKFLRNQSLNAVGLFELPRTLPILITRCDGTAWYRLGSPEHAP
jgi:hypothetical protein